MSLRIRTAPIFNINEAPLAPGSGAAQADDWTSRLAKLIPAEALALYGAGVALTQGKSLGLWVLALASLFVAGAIRYKATRGAATGPQWTAIGLAMGSFVMWLAALPDGATPLPLGENSYLATIAALAWTTIVPIVYKGD